MADHNTPRILCMEDDKATARMVQKWLQRAGYLVEFAWDGAEGLAKCRQETYDAIIVDYSMPVHDGLKVIRRLKAQDRLPPAIVMTATGNEALAVESLQAGAADYLVKDGDGEFVRRLPAALNRAMELRRLQAALAQQQELLATVTSNIPGIVYRCRTDESRSVEFISDYVEQLTGHTAAGLREPGRGTLSGWIHPGDVDSVRQRIRDAIDSRQSYSLEYRIRRADDQVRWVSDQGRVATDPTGEALWLDGVILDITERRMAEEAVSRRLEAERLINSVSAQFTDIELPQLEDVIHETLKKAGICLGGDRVTAFLLSASGEVTRTVFQWSNTGVPSTLPQCLLGTLEKPEGWMAMLRRREAVVIPDAESLPQELATERAILESHQIRSILLVPALASGRLRGYVTVVSVRTPRNWSEDDVRVMRVISDIIFGAVQRVEAKESLRRERDFAEALVDNARAIVLLLDCEGRIMRSNKYTEELTGWQLREIQGKDLVDTLIPFTDRQRARDAIEQSFCGIPISGMSVPIVTCNGQIREVEWYGRLLRDDDGEVLSLLAVGHDTTERRRTEQELQWKTEALTMRVRQINCLHSISRLLESDDLPLAEIIRQAVALIPRGWQKSEAACARIMFDGLVFQTANFTETLWKQAAPVFIEGRLAGAVEVCYLEAPQGKCNMLFRNEERELIQDIAERVGKVIERCRAEAKVRSLQRQIEYILGATKTGLCITDPECRLRYVDQAWQRIYGNPAGKNLHDYFGQCDSQCHKCSTTQALQTKEAVISSETLPGEGGRPVQVTTIPFLDEQGEWLIAKVYVDVSRLKQLERELAQSQKLEAIGQLAAGIAHEINTPTQYIGDNTRFLQDAFDDLDKLFEQLPRFIEAAKDGNLSTSLVTEVDATIQNADLGYLVAEIPKAIHASLDGVDRVATIVRAMKEFSHPGSESKQAIDLNRAIESTLTVSRNEWKYVADLATSFDPQLPPVPCYPSDLNQAVLNLLINAGQAIAEAVGNGRQAKGLITVETRRDGDWAEIRIADTGPGIADAIRSKVFDPFFTTKDVGKGTGQGLAIAYNTIVEKHQGTIHFETEVGQGTTFIIRLPLSAGIKEPENAHEQTHRIAR